MNLIYWITTSFISVFLLLSSYTYLLSSSTISGIKELGFPDFFRIELAILKTFAAVLILIPTLPAAVKEWIYAGIFLFLITAIVAHIAHGDSPIITIINILLIADLVISYIYWSKAIA